MKTKLKGETKLERNVANWINERIADYEGGAKAVIEELLQHGCVSGLVGHLIYYSDTCTFYSRNKAEINALLKDALQDSGCKSPADLFGDKWDSEDPLADEDMNQNLLAWFGFEETARKLADKAGIEV